MSPNKHAITFTFHRVGDDQDGVDGAVNTYLSSTTPNEYVQDRVKARIVQDDHGELPVGSAVAVTTAHHFHRVLIYAPTMRVPEPLPEDTIVPYLAFRAVLKTLFQIQEKKVSTLERLQRQRSQHRQREPPLSGVDERGDGLVHGVTDDVRFRQFRRVFRFDVRRTGIADDVHDDAAAEDVAYIFPKLKLSKSRIRNQPQSCP